MTPSAQELYDRYVRNPNKDLVPTEEIPDDLGRFGKVFFAHQGLQAMKWVQYLPVYDRLLGPLTEGFTPPGGVRRPLRFLEIGVSKGGSLQLWREFFGPDAVIFGVDIDPRCAEVAGPGRQVRIGSQANPAFLRSVVEMGGVDVVLDDGSHVASHQRADFDTLFPLLSMGGLYVVEDTHSSYWAKYGGGLRGPGAFIETAKGLVDGMHKWYFRAPVGRRSRVAQTEVVSVQFYDSIVVIEKGEHRRPEPRWVGRWVENSREHDPIDRHGPANSGSSWLHLALVALFGRIGLASSPSARGRTVWYQ